MAYLIVCPFLPPSLIATIRANQQQFVEDRWSAGSFTALGLVAPGLCRVWLADPEVRAHYVRFFALFAWVAGAIPLLDVYVHSHFIPQPARYTAEMELGIALIAAPLPGVALVAHAAQDRDRGGGVSPESGGRARRRVPAFTQQATRPVDMRSASNIRMAHWVDRNLPGQRVMVPGSIAQWLNVFSEAPQLSGAASPPRRTGISRTPSRAF